MKQGTRMSREGASCLIQDREGPSDQETAGEGATQRPEAEMRPTAPGQKPRQVRHSPAFLPED